MSGSLSKYFYIFPQTTKPEFTDNYPEKRKYPDDFLIKAEYHLSIVANLLLAASSRITHHVSKLMNALTL